MTRDHASQLVGSRVNRCVDLLSRERTSTVGKLNGGGPGRSIYWHEPSALALDRLVNEIRCTSILEENVTFGESD